MCILNVDTNSWAKITFPSLLLWYRYRRVQMETRGKKERQEGRQDKWDE